MREKELQIKRQNLMQKLRIFGLAFLLITIVGGGFWAWKTNAVSRFMQATSDKFYGLTVKAGYSVENLYLEGRNRTPMDEINQALDIDKNYPILRLKLEEVRARLEKIESIKYAAIERALPNTLYVRVVEREPVALWQHQGKIALVDDNGVVMNGLDLAPYKSLPLIVGEDAPKHVVELLTLLAAQPDLAKRFTAAVWVGERRWNIKMRPKGSGGAEDGVEDIEVRLPEKDSLGAWKQLAEMQKKQQVLDRDVKVIDLRIDGRLFIKLPANETNSRFLHKLILASNLLAMNLPQNKSVM